MVNTMAMPNRMNRSTETLIPAMWMGFSGSSDCIGVTRAP
jgi:hypothetical protein